MMKKSQILAALALAFALGVVAPVAGTYATVIDAPSAAEASAVQSAANVAIVQANLLEHFADYEVLYNGVNGANGIVAEYKKVSDKYVKLFNENFSIYGTGSVNEQISIANTKAASIINDASLKEGVVQTTTAELSQLTAISEVSTLKQAYDKTEEIIKAVKRNISILEGNYNTAKQEVLNARTAYKDILYNLDPEFTSENSGDNNAWWMKGLASDLNTANTNVTNTFGTNPDVTQRIKNISESAYEALVNNSNWTTPSATMTAFQLAEDYGLIANTAKNLPKFNYVKAVSEAKAEVAQIVETGLGATEVSYAKAQEYIAKLNTAIANYKNGTTTNPGDQQPTDPDTKPGDDSNKDDNKTPTSPDTGILSTAEGSASTTISIVAGLATALTALGAGVVAYRNARRSSEK